MPVLDHVTHWAFFDLCMIEVHEERPRPFSCATVCHFDLEHGLRNVFQCRPDTDALEEPGRSQSHGI